MIHSLNPFEGWTPECDLLASSDGKLYGATEWGGGIPAAAGAGVLFSFDLRHRKTKDVTASVSRKTSHPVYDAARDLYHVTLTLTNNSPTDLAGPLQIEFTHLSVPFPPAAFLANEHGTHDDLPFLTLDAGIKAGASTTVELLWTRGDATYGVRVLQGSL